MQTDHAVDETIRNLESLCVHLGQQVHQADGPLSPGQLLRKEALLTTRVLLSKLRLVRNFSRPDA